MLVDAPRSRAAGTMTLRHPGATRLLGEMLGREGRDWLGDGSLAVIAQVALRPGLLAAENLDVVAGGLRLRGPLALNWEQPRPRVTGQLAGETWQVPAWPESLSFAPLLGFDLELGLTAGQAVREGWPELDEPRAQLRLEAGQLAVELTEGRLSGGALRGSGRLDARAVPPRWTAELQLDGARITAPLLGHAPDVETGQIDGRLSLQASGHGPSAWRASLGGTGEVTLRDGVLIGFDLSALSHALAAPGMPGLDAALAEGGTPFHRLSLPFSIQAGLARLGPPAWESEAGIAGASGQVDLVRDTMDVRIALPQAAGPEIGLRFGGPLDSPRRLAETGAYRRWRSERE